MHDTVLFRFTVSEASTDLSDGGGVEVNFLRVTYVYSRFVIVGQKAPGFGISAVFLTIIREVGNPYCITEVSYPLPVLKFLGLEA